jgi:uncharacterized protein (TIRG00374 family)
MEHGMEHGARSEKRVEMRGCKITLLTGRAIKPSVNREISLPKIQVSKSTALVLFGLGIYLAYLRHLGFGEVAESLDGMNPVLFLAALTLSLLMVAFNALSWKRVAEELDYGASLRDLFLIYLSSIFLNNLIPSGSFSGETARIYFLGKVEGGSASRFDASFASVAASRIITAVPFVLGMILGLAYLTSLRQVPGWALTTCFAMMVFTVSAGFAFVGICFEERWLQRMVSVGIGPLERIFHRELDREVCSGAVSGFMRSMLLLRHKNRALLVSLAWAFGGWLCLEAVAFAAFRSLGVDVSLLAIFAVYSVIIVFQTLPLGLPGGIGLVEILMTALFSAVGISIYDAAAVTILIRLVQLWFLALLGGISTVHLMRRIEKDRDRRAASKSSTDAGI